LKIRVKEVRKKTKERRKTKERQMEPARLAKPVEPGRALVDFARVLPTGKR